MANVRETLERHLNLLRETGELLDELDRQHQPLKPVRP